MREGRYRAVEAQLFDDAGIQPVERWVALRRTSCRARILETGDGVPALFWSGGPLAAATWAYVAARTRGVRWFLVDRPGTGLSPAPPNVPGPAQLPTYVSDLVADALDALEVDRATLVGASLGGYAALRASIVHPDRIERLVLAGCPAFVPGWSQPGFFTALRAPVVGRLLLRMPVTRASARLSLRGMGHQRSLREGRIPEAMLAWTRAWQRDTDTMRNDAAMISACGTWRHGFDRSLDLTDGELSGVQATCAILSGSDDIVGNEAVVRALADRLPNAEVDVRDGAGHLPWLDDPSWMAGGITRFCAAVS